MLIDADMPANSDVRGTVEEAPFYIPAVGPSARPRRVLKHGDTFAVFDSFGDMGASAGGPDGLFDHDTRYLSRLELLINGMQPLLLGSSVRDDNLTMTADLTNPDLYFDGHITLPRDTIHIVRTSYLWKGVAHQRVSVVNHGEETIKLTITISFSSDFADLFEARGQRRTQRGTMRDSVQNGSKVRYDYAGLDKAPRTALLQFDPAPDQLSENAAVFRLTLPRGASRNVFIAVECHGETAPFSVSFFRGLMAAYRDRRLVSRRSGSVETSNGVFNEAIRRAMADLCILSTTTKEGIYPYAGIPWYSTTFGRDGMITALQMLWCDPEMARGVLLRLADLQAKTVDASADAQPGKILHEMRGGEMAALKEVPFGLYYGSVDSTPLFVILLGAYVKRTGDTSTLRAIWPAAVLALSWLENYGDVDGDGFIEYGAVVAGEGLQHGLRNQGWKDSFDAIFHEDGELAQGPIALCEVQGYAFAAKLAGARCARLLGDESLAAKWEKQAEDLAKNFEDHFWCENLGFYVLALDGDKKPCRVRTSNAGQLLWSGIVRPDRAKKVADALLEPDFFSGWGIRTVAEGEARYNPMSYHNGSVWPHDNSLIALGLARYGFHHHVVKVFEAMFAAASYMELRRLPELYCGFRRRSGNGPTLYPVACAPQAWSAGALFMVIETMVGLEFDAKTREVRFRNPQLPPAFEELTLRQLSLGGAKVDVELHQTGSHVSVRVLKASGDLQVVTIISPEAEARLSQHFGSIVL